MFLREYFFGLEHFENRHALLLVYLHLISLNEAEDEDEERPQLPIHRRFR
jgi:hypothetical protein